MPLINFIYRPLFSLAGIGYGVPATSVKLSTTFTALAFVSSVAVSHICTTMEVEEEHNRPVTVHRPVDFFTRVLAVTTLYWVGFIEPNMSSSKFEFGIYCHIGEGGASEIRGGPL